MCCSWLDGWTIRKDLDPATLLGALATVGIGVLIYLLGKRLSSRRFEREYVITLFKDVYPLAKSVHVLFYEFTITRSPISPKIDHQIRARISQLRDQVLLVTDAMGLMKKHCETVSAAALTENFRRFKAAVTTNTLGHTNSYDLSNKDIATEESAYREFLRIVHSSIFELNAS